MFASEPPMKKLKTEEDTIKTTENYIERVINVKKNLEPILSQDINESIPLIKVYVGTIKEPKTIRNTILLLSEKMPMKELQHLKRVRKKDIILCPINYLDGTKCIKQYINDNISALSDVFEYFQELDVPMYPPKLKKQLVQYNKIWSCNFHPNSYLENLVSGSFFKPNELALHRTYMSMTFEILNWSMINIKKGVSFDNTNAAVIVDPILQSVVAVAFDNRQEHPVQHSTMLAIDNVAKTQGGGAWRNHDLDSISYNALDSIYQKLWSHLSEKYSDIKFGTCGSENKNESEKDYVGAYLCTGYYVYLLREPCIMCSMGLVHARAKRVFFTLENSVYGALKSKTRLQSIKSLNHHFEVFSGFL